MDRILKFGLIAFLIPFFSEVDFSKILRFVDRTKASVYHNLPVLQYPIVPSWWDVRRPSHLLNSYQTPSGYIRQERHWLCNWLTSMFYLKSRRKKNLNCYLWIQYSQLQGIRMQIVKSNSALREPYNDDLECWCITHI